MPQAVSACLLARLLILTDPQRDPSSHGLGRRLGVHGRHLPAARPKRPVTRGVLAGQRPFSVIFYRLAAGKVSFL
ncbi:hypothetical protein AvCA_18920 [Azotobacter vinelandii CA]|uniref:Uncharacterized protein n=2 Tax=Azotobacter vinelandii TaxID=354 RepID=C1DDY3_AZOVD|nr:hypothetical protein Avin_18920 [Azotobacter vinelandii DJ]AGK16857.1 hypothetical protein AvCA_18920 [Azotobacter vinelandii CA]AGK20258.1 hypothetical protein AvCA6_18920 [Azotobacter vinelandii CA6]